MVQVHVPARVWGFESPLRHHDISRGPSLRSGFRLRAPASLTPAKRLKFKSLLRHQVFLITKTFLLAIFLCSPSLAQGGTAAQTRMMDLVLRFPPRSEEHTSELQSLRHLVCRLLLE